MTPKQLLTGLTRPRAVTLALGLVALIVAGCDDPTVSTPAESIEKARSHIAKGDYQAGVIELKNALQLESDNAEARLLLGTTYLELYNIPGAAKELRRASGLGADVNRLMVPLGRVKLMNGRYQELLAETQVVDGMPPELRAEIYSLRGNAKLRMRRAEEAAKEYSRALEEKPDYVEAIVGLGAAALARGDRETAEQQLVRAREVDDNYHGTHLLDGDIGSSTRDFDRAEAAFKKAVELNQRAPEGRFGLIWAQLQNGNNDDAIETLSPLLKSQPHHPTLNYFSALAYFQKQDHQPAKDYAEAALLARPGHVPSRLIAGTSSYMVGAFEQARRHLEAVVAEVPDHAHARKVLAASMLALGDSEDAAKVLEGVEIETANDAQLLAAVGQQVLRQGDHASSLDFFERAVEISPDSSSARASLAAAKLGLGDSEEAVVELKRALELNPQNIGASALLIMNYINEGKFDEALDQSIQLQSSNPESPHGYTLAGLAQGGRNNLQDAVEMFEKALEVSPGDYNATNNLAQILIAGGKNQEAIDLYKMSLEANPNHGTLIAKLAQLELDEGNTQAAIDYVKQVIELEPEKTNYKIALGRMYLSTGEPLKALDAVEEARVTEPQNPVVLELVGNAQLATQQMPEAIETYQAWKSVQPDSAIPYIGLARVYEEQDDLFKAGQEISKAIEVDPENAGARFFYARLLAKARQFDQANKELADLREKYPDSPEVAELAGDIAMVRGHISQAVESYTKAWENRQTNFLLSRLSRAEAMFGQGDQAIERMENWVENNPEDMTTRFVLAEVYLMESQDEKAIEQYQVLVERVPQNFAAQNNLAWILAEQGDLEGALNHAEQARVLAPNDVSVMDTLAVIYLKSGRAEEALELLQVANAAGTNPTIKYHLAQAHVDLGNREEAVAVLRDLLGDVRPFGERQQAEALLNELES